MLALGAEKIAYRLTAHIDLTEDSNVVFSTYFRRLITVLNCTPRRSSDPLWTLQAPILIYPYPHIDRHIHIIFLKIYK